MWRALLLILFLALGATFPLKGGEGSPVQLELLQEEESIQAARPFWVAVKVRVEKGWHLSGCEEDASPLDMTWQVPQGFKAGPLHGPKSHLLEDRDEWVFLSQIEPPPSLDSNLPLKLEAEVRWLACSDTQCRPGATRLHLPLSISVESPQPHIAHAVLFEQGRAQWVALSSEKEEDAIGWILAGAVLGGIILNLMPCVLPVLSLKIMNFVQIAGQTRRILLVHGFLFTLGVLVSFWCLAGVMLGLRAYGHAVGWGFQLQQPLFVIGLASLLFLFALNLFGVFEWGTAMAAWAGQREGEVLQQTPGYGSSFLSGVLATAVATPCTGPFLGTAVGVALTFSPLLALAVFTAIALGMALPYLLLSAFPAYLSFIPRRGAWMERFKEVMGFLLLFTVLWLLWVFSAQTNLLSLLCVLGGFLFFAMAAWLYGKGCVPHMSRYARWLACGGVLALGWIGCYTIALPYHSWSLQQEHDGHLSPSEWEGWEPFSIERVEALRRQGRPVLIDFTAKWCLICQANHLILSGEKVSQSLAAMNVAKLKADWTTNDPSITEALAKFGRNSVPLYVFYPSHPQASPRILPQILTEDIVHNLLRDLHHNEEIVTHVL